EHLSRLLEVELPTRVRRLEALVTSEDVRGRRLALSVELGGDGLAVRGKVHRLAYRRIRQERVRRVLVRALAIDLGIRVREVDMDTLERRSLRNDDLAVLAALLDLLENIWLDLQVPCIVIFAGLAHRARGRRGITTALQQHAA